MRQYIRQLALGMSLCGAMTLTYADPYFGNNAPPKPAATPQSSTVLSPTEFAARVKMLSNETANRLQAETTAALPKPAPVPQTMPTTPIPTTPTNTVNAYTNQPKTSQPSTYTGFGTGTVPASNASGTKPATKAAPQSGGWKIQY
jgi:hypothetical protein